MNGYEVCPAELQSRTEASVSSISGDFSSRAGRDRRQGKRDFGPEEFDYIRIQALPVRRSFTPSSNPSQTHAPPAAVEEAEWKKTWN